MYYKWSGIQMLEEKQYTCGYCSVTVGPNRGYVYRNEFEEHIVKQIIYICPNCNQPTHYNLNNKTQTPSPVFGEEVDRLPSDIERLYNQARRCYSIGAFDAIAMISRKIIMNTAVFEGAKEKMSFIEYVNFLDEDNLVSKNAKKWLNKLRELGNEANHEIKAITKIQAEEALKFVAILLKNVFGMQIDE